MRVSYQPYSLVDAYNGTQATIRTYFIADERTGHFPQFKSNYLKFLPMRLERSPVVWSKIKYGESFLSLRGKQLAVEFFKPMFVHRDTELLITAFVDAEARVRQLSTFPGDTDIVRLGVPDILRTAVLNECAGIIIAHNHPSDIVKPSQSDVTFTRKLALSSEAVGIELVDHIIFTTAETFSFRENNLL